MKEEAETCRKLPPKIMGGGVGGGLAMTMAPASMVTINQSSSSNTTSAGSLSSIMVNSSTPSKLHNDEILTSLLRMNNFDSISSIKDESLDIDLSACVTITADTSGMIGGNSLSSSDFWRVLDESAQTSQLDGSGSSTNTSIGQCSGGVTSKELLQRPTSPTSSNNTLISSEKTATAGIVVKKEQTDFSGTFLKPSVGITFSPLKRCIKSTPADNPLLKDKSPTRLMKADSGGGGITSTGPPSLAPLVRIHQFPKPSIELLKLNGTNSTNTNEIVIKKEIISITQPPPLAALDTTSTPNTTGKTETPAPKVVAEPVYKCMDCNVAFQGSHELANHTNHHMIYKCMECNREFDVETSLKKHLKTHRPIDARKDAWKKCPDCGKCLKLGSMWMHRKIHTENKKYGCEICGQKFVQKINLTHHQRIHTSEKPYECSECQKRFQERSHLQRHQKYHAQTRSYRCEKCGKMYKTERCLKVHNLVHLEQRPFACTVCDKSFISNSKLKQHSNIHTGERPFKCNYCPRDFTNFPNWLKHTRRRHKVDHKTGEMLENIPSYCSKKSTRTPKEKKPTAAEVKAQANAAKIANAIPTLNNQNPMNLNVGIDLNKMDTTIVSSVSTTATTTTIVASMVPPPHSVTVAPKITVAINGPPPLAKVPAKRKKKVPTPTTAVVIKNENDAVAKSYIITSTPIKTQTQPKLITSNGGVGPPPLALVFNTKPLNVATNLTTTSITTPLMTSTQHSTQPQQQQQQQSLKPPAKVEKSKRERKQPMPKQVQQVPPPLIIKKEFIEPKSEIIVQHQTQDAQQQQQLQQQQQQQHRQRQQSSQSQSQQTKAPFPDLHCLSITSAEELIMEQALEMEECGLYKSPATSRRMDGMPNFGDTDNAISSEALAHFKIKEEHHDMELKTEEFDPIKKNLGSSLESSPFSSPASMEFASSSVLASDFATNSFYLPPFTLTNNQIITTNTSISTAMKIENSHVMAGGATIHRVQVPQLVAANLSVPELIQITQNNQRQIRANLAAGGNTNISNHSGDNASSFINQLYLPLTVNAGPVLMKSHQALPSVDTLLFSHSKLGLFSNRNLPKQATTAQHNLS